MTTTASCFPAAAPVVRRVRAYFAPVNRTTNTPAIFDSAQAAAFQLDAPPAPWMTAGCVQNLVRTSASKNTTVLTGAPAAAVTQVRESLQADVSLEFLSWTKLTMALATGSEHRNVLQGDAIALQSGSTETFLAMSAADAAKFSAGQAVAVDGDYAGETGYVGSPVAGAYARQPLSDASYTRRVTFNVGTIRKCDDTGLTLAGALPGGAPAPGAKVQTVTGFVDCEGGAFRPEWSALFVMEGTLGERVFFYYPRLQPACESTEAALPLTSTCKLTRAVLKAQWHALPVADPLTGDRILCWRTFVPAANAQV